MTRNNINLHEIETNKQSEIIKLPVYQLKDLFEQQSFKKKDYEFE